MPPPTAAAGEQLSHRMGGMSLSASSGAVTPQATTPAGPIQTIAGTIAMPAAPPAIRFPEYKPGSPIKLGDQDNGQVFDAVFIGESPNGARVRIAGREVELSPEELDIGRDAAQRIGAAQKAKPAVAPKAATTGTDPASAQPAAPSSEPPPAMSTRAPKIHDFSNASDAEFTQRLNFLTGQGARNGWNRTTTRERDALTQENNARNPAHAGRAPVQRNTVKPDKAITARGREIGVEYAVVDLDSLIPSQRDDGRPNPDYPAELQPRDRTSDMSQEQIRRIAGDLRPELLGETPQASNGAPIILPSGEVISGNGRTLALRRAAAENPEASQRYADWIKRQGYQTEGIRRPVLVRVISDEMSNTEAADVAREANERDQQAMSLPEQAVADAKSITPAMLDTYQGGDIDAASNRELLRAFMRHVVPANEHAGLFDRNGVLTQPAITRINAALLGRAYSDRWLIGAVLESNDSNIRAIGGALVDASANWAKMRADEERGMIASGADRTEPLIEAVKIVDRARREGRPISDYVEQQDIFEGDTVSPAAQQFLGLFFRDKDFRRPRSREKIAEALNFYAVEAMKNHAGR